MKESYKDLEKKVRELAEDDIKKVLKERGCENSFNYVIKRIVGKSIFEDVSTSDYDAIEVTNITKDSGFRNRMKIVIDRLEEDGSKSRFFMSFLFTDKNHVLDETEGVY